MRTQLLTQPVGLALLVPAVGGNQAGSRDLTDLTRHLARGLAPELGLPPACLETPRRDSYTRYLGAAMREILTARRAR